MIRSLPFDLALVVTVTGLFKYFVEPIVGYPWMYVLVLFFAIAWVLAAARGEGIARRLPAPLRRLLRRRESRRDA